VATGKYFPFCPKQSKTSVVHNLMYRRLSSSKVNNAGNSHVEHARDSYEMSSDRNSQHTYSTIDVQSGASAPVMYTNGMNNAW